MAVKIYPNTPDGWTQFAIDWKKSRNIEHMTPEQAKECMQEYLHQDKKQGKTTSKKEK